MASGISIEVTIDDSPVRAVLQRMIAFDADSLHPALDAIGAAMETSTMLRFDAGAGPGGVAWLPSQRAKRTGSKTLILTGRLWHSIVHNVIGNTVEWGTNVVYAAIHQLGGTIERQPHSHTIYRKAGKDGIEPGFVKKRHSNFAQDVAVAAYNITIPARPFLGVDAQDLSDIRAILEKMLSAMLTAGGARFLSGRA